MYCNTKSKNKMVSFILIILLFTFVLSACTSSKEEEQNQLIKKVNIAALNGPTGIGMVGMMEQSDKYNINIYQSPDEVIGKVITGEVDMASVPSNLAAVLYKKTEGNIVLLSPNTLGVLYLLEKGDAITELSDLKGKTIFASGKGGAPEYILKRLILNAGLNPEKDVDIKWLVNHTDVSSSLISSENGIALLPEPFVSVALSKDGNIKIASDLNDEWKKSYDMELPMGALIARKEFVQERSTELPFIMEDYKSSVDLVNNQTEKAAELVSKYVIIQDEKIAIAAIPKCNIMISDDSEYNETIINNFYEILFSMDPKSVGGQIPDEEFYYEW